MTKNILENKMTGKYEDYKNKILNICAVCQKNFVNSWEQYKERGNYCSPCNAKCNALSKEAIKRRDEVLDAVGLDK